MAQIAEMSDHMQHLPPDEFVKNSPKMQQISVKRSCFFAKKVTHFSKMKLPT
jgi:hypothetical protein